MYMYYVYVNRIGNTSKFQPPVCCHFFVVGRNVYLNDPDSYADCRFYTPKSDRLKDRGQTK